MTEKPAEPTTRACARCANAIPYHALVCTYCGITYTRAIGPARKAGGGWSTVALVLIVTIASLVALFMIIMLIMVGTLGDPPPS